VVAVLGPQPEARSIRQPEPTALGLFGGHFQPLASPDALDPLVVHQPARLPQQGTDLAVAIAAIPARQLDEIGRERFFVVFAPRHLALCRAMLPQSPAGAALGDVQGQDDVLDTGAPAGGA